MKRLFGCCANPSFFSDPWEQLETGAGLRGETVSSGRTASGQWASAAELQTPDKGAASCQPSRAPELGPPGTSLYLARASRPGRGQVHRLRDLNLKPGCLVPRLFNSVHLEFSPQHTYVQLPRLFPVTSSHAITASFV